ncbi:asparagine synthase (glutamine-hydrolyzing) [Emcibacteraceae bacterium]|nr:asparagine synthase (glutamine-hydrolyzing) [Emcibacteraceae bacterium]
MCGFFGIIQENPDKKIAVKKISTLMEHRGPDDWGWLSLKGNSVERGRKDIECSGNVVLSHQRLSIIDLTESGWQPMISGCERFSISYNGEIYNYIELKNELINLGHSFSSDTDTEVILEAWKKWGIDCVARFKGMFAFSLLDKELGRIYLARDFFGIKPAYYCQWENGWGFGSTLNSLKSLRGVSSERVPQKVYEFLRRGMSDRGENTLYKDINQVLPGSILEFDINSLELITKHTYRQLNPAINTQISFNDAVIKTRELFVDSVKLHMRSDVRIGAALSGGIDSSAIVCTMRHLCPELELHTFTFVSEDEQRSEEKWADIVNKHTNAIAHKIKPESNDIIKDIDHLFKAQEEPFSSTSIYAQYKVFEAVKHSGVKVILDGQGADEMLGGYMYYQGARLATLIRKGNFKGAIDFMRNTRELPGRSNSLLFKLAGSYLLPQSIIPLARQMSGKSFYPKWLNKDWLKKNNIQNRVDKIKRDAARGYLTPHLIDSLQGLAHLLRYEDRNSMFHSIESRVPFLIPELAEFLLSLPESYLISDNGVSKYVFREAMREIVPDSILDRQDKIGFEPPQNIWLHQMEPLISKLFEERPQTEEVNLDYVKDDINKLLSHGLVSDSHHIWRVFNSIWSIKSDEVS